LAAVFYIYFVLLQPSQTKGTLYHRYAVEASVVYDKLHIGPGLVGFVSFRSCSDYKVSVVGFVVVVVILLVLLYCSCRCFWFYFRFAMQKVVVN
jgi:hypothetical protein